MTNVDIIKKIFGKKAFFVRDDSPESVYFKYPVTVGGMWAPGDGIFNGFEPDKKIKFRSCNIGLSNIGSSDPYHLAVAVHEAMHAVIFLQSGREHDTKIEADVNNMAQEWIIKNVPEPTKTEMLKALEISRKSYGIKVESFREFVQSSKGVAADKLYDLAQQGHGRWIGSCGHVIKQCRCSAHVHKGLDMDITTMSLCPKCKETKKKPNFDQK